MAPSLVQVSTGATVTSGALTVTLSATGAGNCLVALIGSCADSANGSVSGITLGGAADNWAQAAIEGNSADHAIATGWADPNCAGGQTSVVISQTGGAGTVQGLMAYVFEFSGLTGTVDASSGGANGFSGTWTSGTSGATVQASEVAFGITCGASNTRGPGLTGPGAPWNNETLLVVAGATRDKAMLCGYQILSATGTQVYSGTSSPTTTNDTLVFTLKAASGTPHTDTAALTVTPAVTVAKGVGRVTARSVTPAVTVAKGVGRVTARSVTPAVAVTTAGGHTSGGPQIVPSLIALGVI